MRKWPDKNFPILLTVAAAETDQEYWIRQGEENANKDLDQWSDDVTALKNDNAAPVNGRLDFFHSQVDDSVSNMNSFVPNLVWIVGQINSIAAGEPNIFRRGELQTILWLIDGKRDNKSYYLLDGAANWIEKRLDDLRAGGEQANDLATALEEAQKSVVALRDELDSNAQAYVKAITIIQQLKADIVANIERKLS